MAHAIPHTPAYPKPAGSTFPLTARELSWGAVIVLAWLGWPVAREFLMWVLWKMYDLYVTYVH